MTEPAMAKLLADPHPGTHIIYPYSTFSHIIGNVSRYVSEGLSRGESVVLIVTAEHRCSLTDKLLEEEINVANLEKDGRLFFLDASALVQDVFLGDTPNPVGFDAFVGTVIRQGITNAPASKVRVFGEMVNVLCSLGHEEAAVRFEELWNTLHESQYVPVLCAYSLNALLPLRDGIRKRLFDAHTEKLGTSSRASTAGE